MKTNFLKRFVAAALAIVMVLLMVPVSPMEVNAVSTTYVLDASDLDVIEQNTTLTDGATQVAGTSDFFTIYYSANSSVDSNSKTFTDYDGFAGTKRINFRGKTVIGDVTKNAVKFTTEGPATVEVWWVCGGDGRQVSIFNESGSLTAQTYAASGSTLKNALYKSDMVLDAAGTYYLGSDDSSNYLFKIEVTVTTEETAPTTEPTSEPTAEPTTAPSAGGTYVLDIATDVPAFVSETKVDQSTEVFNDYFTLHYSSKTKVEERTGDSIKNFDDGYSGTRRLNFNGEVKTTKESIEFTTTDKAVVKVWWAAGDADRQMRILDSTGAVVATTEEEALKDAAYISTLELSEAGTYFLGGTPKKNYIFKVEVIEGATAEDTTEPTTEPTSEPTTEPTSEPTTEPTTEPTSEPTTEPTTEATTAPTAPVEIPSYDSSKIDVWDFAAEQLDTGKYNNMLTVDEINSWFSEAAGTTGVTTGGFTTSDGQLSFVGGGKTNHRLRVNTDYTDITCYDRGKYLQDANGNIYNGYIYSNAGGNTGVQIQIAAEAGDILTFVHCSNGTAATVHFEAPSGNVVTTEFTPADSKDAQVTTFYAAETGTYKFYYSVEKLVVARIYRQHTNEVTVSGTVTAPSDLSGYSLVFTCNESGAETVAPVSSGTYTAKLNDSYTYTVSLKDANGYIITSSDALAISAGSADVTFDATVLAVAQVTINGNITGLDEAALAKLSISLKSDAIYVPTVKISGTTYTMDVEVGVEYEVVVEGINDYQLSSPASVSYVMDGSADISFAAKPVYAITIEPTGATAADLANATFTFTNLNEEGYVYEFVGTENIALRDGTYSVKVSNSGIYVQQLTSNLKVDGAAAAKTIPFSSDITVWDFSAEDFAGTSPYNGLEFSNAQKNKTYLLSNAGTISVPVKGDCQIKISACYKYSFESDTTESQDKSTGSTSQIDTYTLSYTGDAGYATINVLGQSYITKIEIVESVPFKDTITVGASGCDYTTINDALDAVRAMERPNNERVTIEIQPGNYEEMLVIDMPNVTLKNASTNPSLELTNKGVDIAANAVRITSYYGHGYSYYSMGSDCKWDETILQVNKENGYESFTNPGSGTTSGSYWNATVVVSGDGFQAEGIIFENSFNQYVSQKAADDVIVKQSSAKEGSVPRADLPVGSTAVQDKAYVERAAALAIANNVSQVSFDNCKFIGRQDTLYGGVGTTAAFYDCSIYGACDYIFGGMTAVFAKCDLVFNTSEDKNDKGYITAPQTASGSHGLLMYNCNVTSTTPGVDTASEYTSKPGYFGRPWAANTGEAVFYMTVIDAADTYWYEQSPSLIVAEGWLNSLSGESALCGEYGTYEYALDVDNSANRASWATVFAEEKLASGEPISVETWLGDWDAFAGKDMTVEIPTEKVDNKPVEEEPEKVPGASYVLDTTLDMTAFGQKDKADGETELFKDFFTIMYSEKNKVDSSNKTFDDGYTATQRLSFGGKTDVANGMLNSIKFTTSNSATVKIWWVAGEVDREFAIYDNGGNILTKTAEGAVKNQLCMSELNIAEAGTYYLGVPDGSNYLFKLEVTEDTVVAEPQEYILDTTLDMTAFGQKDKADGETELFKDFFTIMYSEKNKVDSSNKTFDDGYTATQRLSFGGKTDVANGMLNSIKFTTSNSATVKIWWVAGEVDREFAIYDNGGNILTKTAEGAVKNQLCMSELSIAEAGTYYLGVPDGSNYLFKLQVTISGGGAEETPRADWATVADPVISGTADDGKGNITVTVTAVVGDDGGDELVVTMYDAEGNELATKRSIAEKGQHTVSFAPTASGDYTFKAALSRADETDKISAEAVGSFILPLETPLISSATSNGGGKVGVVWGEVPEATAYNVYCDGVLVGTTDKTEFEVSGLTVGTCYSFTVSAVRGEEETAQSAAATATATENAQRVWGFTTYGSSTSTSSNGYVGSVNEDGKVTVYSEGGKGKIVPNSTDGVAFYYTAVPSEYNFTLRANVHVDSWTLSNGQEGFGLLATDRLGPNGDSTGFWNNSYMAALTKNEYRYDSDTGTFYSTSESLGTKYSMKLGVTTIAKTGVTPENLPLLNVNDSTTVNNEFVTVSDTLEHYASKEAMIGENYINNIVGNMTNADSTGVYNSRNLITDFVLEIQKNNTGYFITYYDKDGNIIRQIKNYDPDALNMVDTENVYVGFFAARNARATFSDIEFSTILASEDAPAEERPITYIEPTIAINSGTTSNSVDYTVSLYANVDGTADVSISGVSVAKGVKLTGGERFDIDTKLVKEGVNTIRVYFTPDPDQDLGEYTELSSTKRIYIYKYITYSDDYADMDYIYVSPRGRESNPGTKESPMNIYQAIKYVQPGQTIVLMEGTYKLKEMVRIEPGVDGTADQPISMIADPEATSRPVLDFQGVAGGMITGGDYWYFQGFDVTNSAPGQKGFQVSGHYNIIDQVNTYNNGNTGLQLSRYQGSDPQSEWPSYNLILNCTSYNNSDPGYEDADGFACKLTTGEGNVFDGCVAYNNADDGWDLYAKVETGPIGAVTIQNCVAYQNGYVIENGVLVSAGNGNGFKMGGESISGKHVLKNSYAFFNKAKGIDSNSGPDIIVENSTSYNNESYNVALYTNNAANTDFSATGIVSFKDETVKSGLDIGEQLKPKGTQDTSKYLGDTNYYWSGSTSVNASGATVTADDFVSLTFQGVKRNADGTINLQGFLELKEGSDINAGAGEGGTASPTPGINPDQPEKPTTPSDPSDPTQPTTPSDPSNPGTGDLSNPIVWALLMAVAGAALVVFTILYRKRSFQA